MQEIRRYSTNQDARVHVRYDAQRGLQYFLWDDIVRIFPNADYVLDVKGNLEPFILEPPVPDSFSIPKV